MKRLGLLFGTLTFASTVLVSGAILVGRASAKPNQLQTLGFEECGANPCYHGLTPGMTGWDKARTVAASLGFEGKDYYLQLDGVTTAHWVVSIEKAVADTLPVRSIEADYVPTSQRKSYAGEIIEAFGEPCGVEYLDVPGIYWISYPTLRVELDNGSLDEFAPVNSILLVDPTEESDLLGHALCGMSEPSHPFEYYRWVGFASQEKYREQLASKYGN